MSDLSEGITALLNDPKSMEQFKTLAGAFLQSAGNKANGPAAAANAYSQNLGNGAPDGGINIDPEVLKTLAGALSGLSGGASPNTGGRAAFAGGNSGGNGGGNGAASGFGGNSGNGSASENSGNLGNLGNLGDLGALSGLSGGLSSLLPGGDSGFDLGAMMKILNILKTNVSDDRAQLLLALRPHLSEERRHRVDKAVKILKLVSLVPIFKEQGILNF